MWRLRKIPQQVISSAKYKLSGCASKRILDGTNRLWQREKLHTGTTVHDKIRWSGPQETEDVEGFVVKTIGEIPELSLIAVNLIHENTGAEYLHLARDDPNNVFCVGFRTTPKDSTGVPHILEHTTLCGSQKYPCRDPFMNMINRSLATFMNAMTGPDYTLYPFSTQNPTDFKNLMSVYLDAVFHPLLRELDFMQEGWRLEHTDPNDQKSPIIIKGVVFNEMKGVFCDPQQYYFQQLLSNLLPSNTYGYVYGGDPLCIPSLSWEGLKKFHASYYHPSNAKFFSYGNFDPLEHLKYINNNYLKNYRKQTLNTYVPREKKWRNPVRKHIKCAMDPLSPDPKRQASITVSYAIGDTTDPLENLVMQVISQLLIGGPNSPFYKSLIESNLGCAFSPTSGFESHTRDTFFTVGLQGVSEEDFEKIISVIEETLDEVIKMGFIKDRIEAILHNIELGMKHQTSSFGLNLVMGLAPIWNHGGDPIDALQISRLIQQFRGLLSDPLYLQDTVTKYFKENNHKLILSMAPTDNFVVELAEKESKMLQRKLDLLDQKAKQLVMLKGKELLAEQSKSPNVACLPKLKISDINADVQRTRLINTSVFNVPVQLTLQPTNNVTYFRGIIDTTSLSKELKMLLPLFCITVNKMGTKNYSYREQDLLIELKSGGLELSPLVIEGNSDVNQFQEGILLSSHCLDENVPDMFHLWKDTLCDSQFTDQPRFENLVRESATEIVNDVTYQGHRYSMGKTSAMISPSAAAKEIFSGLSYIQIMRTVSQMENLIPVMNQMKEIFQIIRNRKNWRFALNVSERNQGIAMNAAGDFVTNIPVLPEKSSVKNTEFIASPRNLHYILPLPIYFTAMSIPAVPFTHPDYAPLRVMTKLLSSHYLHSEIREKSGAYGGGIGLSMTGVLNFFSYRDPNCLKTFEVFGKSNNWITQRSFTEDHIVEAKLRVFQEVDAPDSPSTKGMKNFLQGISDDNLQEHRQHLIHVTGEDIVRVSESYLKRMEICGKVCIGPQFENENKVWEKVNW